MRPCRRCSFALDNNAAACPRCGAALTGAPKAAPGPAVEARGPARQTVNNLSDIATSVPDGPLGLLLWFPFALPYLLLLSIPLIPGGVIGYVVWGDVGALAGVIVAAVIFVGVKAWREEQQGAADRKS